jgi:type IV pilus assembly protein PilM
MLKSVQSWFAPRANPIGVDFGSDCLRLAQVQQVGNSYRLVAAASADVPDHVRHNASARMAFFVETVRDLLAQGNFKTKQAVLSIPASSMFIQHLRMARLDESETRKALTWEARGKLPIDPSQAVLRHLVAGEVYQDQDPKNEVIVMAATRDLVNQFLASAAKARLDVVGMNVEPKALVDCFAHVQRRREDSQITQCFLDVGMVSSRAIIAHGDRIMFARVIPIGGEHLNKAAADALKISLDQAKLLRVQLSCNETIAAATMLNAVDAPKEQMPDSSEASGFALLDAGLQASRKAVAPAVEAAAASEPAGSDPAAELARQGRIVEQALREPINRLIEELDLCRRYHESTFASHPIDQLVFVGGEARQHRLCKHIAEELGMSALIGDPMTRIDQADDTSIENGIDRRQPQPGWAVALGLSMGPMAKAQETKAKAG